MTRPASYRTNLVTALLGVWFTLGLFLDAWAHNNVPELETFFTPWHAVFYTGFVATAGWIAWTVRDALPPSRNSLRAMPPGYAGAAVAVVGFGLAGTGDMIWHTVFGIEQNIDILFSPTHLGLAAAMLVILTTPLRAAWADTDTDTGADGDADTGAETGADGGGTRSVAPGLLRLLPAVLGTAFAAAVVLLFAQYANALTLEDVTIVAGLSSVDDGFTEVVVGHLAITTVILTAPLLTLARRWVPPFGAATIVYAAVAMLSGAITGFHYVKLTVALLLAGVAVDLLVRWLRPTADAPARFRAFAALAPLVTWTIYLAAAHVATPQLQLDPGGTPGPPEAIVELYVGVPIVQALIGLLLAALFVPSTPTRVVSA